MTLSERNPLVAWAFFFERRPARTDLCRLFWRAVLLTPLKLALCGLIGGLMALAIINAADVAKALLIAACVLVGFAALGFIIYLFEEERIHVKVIHYISTSPVSAPVRYVKANYCPRIDIMEAK